MLNCFNFVDLKMEILKNIKELCFPKFDYFYIYLFLHFNFNLLNLLMLVKMNYNKLGYICCTIAHKPLRYHLLTYTSSTWADKAVWSLSSYNVVVSVGERFNAAGCPFLNGDVVVHHSVWICADNSFWVGSVDFWIGVRIDEIVEHAEIVTQFMAQQLK